MWYCLSNVGKGLLLAQDSYLQHLVSEASSSHRIVIEKCSDPASFARLVAHCKFDIVFVDFGLSQARISIEAIRSSPSNKHAVIVAITSSSQEAKRAFASSVTLILQEPLSPLLAEKAMNAGYGLILRERRRYFRCSVDASLTLFLTARSQSECQLVNISESGACILAPHRLSSGDHVTVQTQLPNAPMLLRVECEVLWSDPENRAGLRFVQIPKASKSGLHEWLNTQMDVQGFPLPTTGGFDEISAHTSLRQCLFSRQGEGNRDSLPDPEDKVRSGTQNDTDVRVSWIDYQLCGGNDASVRSDSRSRNPNW